MEMGEETANWSELLQEILGEIATRLKRPEEISRFRAVCRNWHTAVPPPNLKLVRPVLTPKVAVFLIQPLAHPSKAWISTVEVKLRQLYPLSRCPAEILSDDFPRALDLRYFNVTLLTESYNFRVLMENQYEYNERCKSPARPELQNYSDLCDSWIWFAFKVLIFPSPTLVNLSVHSTTLDLDLVVLQYPGPLLTSKFSRDNELRISIIHCNDLTVRCDDIILFKGRVYALDQTGRLYVVTKETKGMELNIFVDVPVCDDSSFAGMRNRLVESFGDLYLVVRTDASHRKVRFRVYKLNEVESRWDEVYNLGDRSLFIGVDSCFFVSTPDLPGCKPNCIVFRKNCFLRVPRPRSKVDVIEDRLFLRAMEGLEIGVFQMGDSDNFGLVSSHIGIPDLLWPPPTWLWPESYLNTQTHQIVNEEQEIKPNLHSKKALVEDQEHAVANACACK